MNKNKSFFIAPNLNIHKSYQDFLEDIKLVPIFQKNYILTDCNNYEMLKILVGSLALKKDVEFISTAKDIDKDQVSYYSENLKDILDLFTHNDSKIILYTSGTTGRHKKIMHSFKSITKGIKINQKYISDIWGLTFKLDKMAGIQVLFQTMLNGATLIDLTDLNKKEVLDAFKEFKITRLSATPTYLKLLVPIIPPITNIKSIASGGEIFDDDLREKVITSFPQSKILNIYASTELGSILRSKSNYFEISKEKKKFIKIKENELLVHKSLYFERRDQKEDWIHTGDMVNVLNKTPIQFKFIGRKDLEINIGGIKINPEECEQAIENISFVSQAIVYAKKNSVVNNILMADVIINQKERTEEDIFKNLRKKLPNYKIPRIINIVDDVKISKGNKKLRKMKK